MPGRQLQDMIIVLPWITGSILAELGGRTRLRDVWAPSGSALWTFLSSMGESLELLPQWRDPLCGWRLRRER
jgi:hypothetical protein